MAFASFEREKCYYGSSGNFIMVLLYFTMNYMSSLAQPNNSINNGASGYMILYFFCFIIFGIPLLYMELTVSQFTARDCLEIWKARSCVSHIGYIQLLWQVFAILNNHAMVTFIVHYFLLSFENPIPYTKCGYKSTRDCDITKNNFTVTSDCLKKKEPLPYCDYIHMTYPEYQYWRYNILGGWPTGVNAYHIAWKSNLASALVCLIVYLHCFKRFRSLKFFLRAMVAYPFLVYVVFLLGSMLQKGIITHYDLVLDTDFSMFTNNVRVSSTLQHVMISMGIGTGTMFNLSSRMSFRAPCYSNSVVTTMLAAAYTLLTISTTALMSCPYVFEHGVRADTVMNGRLTMAFEKLPRLISQFEKPVPYFILMYSGLGCVGISTDVALLFTFTEMVLERYQKLARYPALVNFAGVFILFLLSIPWLGSFGINYLQTMFRYHLSLLPPFICVTECIVFVFWYGFDRFSEDIHFMQGTQPKTFMKFGWTASIVVYAYVFCNELLQYSPFTNLGSPWGFLVLMLFIGSIVVTFIGRLLVALCRRKFREEVQLDSSWGPKNDVLQRSRAMFTAQAITKEYLYRQYHLQAGIVARQRRSNVRSSFEHYERTSAVI